MVRSNIYSFGLYHEDPFSFRVAQGSYFLELMVRPNKVIMSIMACLKCFPKRCESVSGLENLEEIWKWMKFSPTIM